MANPSSKPAGFQPEPTFSNDHRYAGKPRCQAWNKNKGQQCLQMPKKLLAGGHPADSDNYTTTCRVHGGDSPRGLDHYNFQDKGYSRFVPGPLGPAVTAFLEAGDPLDLIQAIGTWEGRVSHLLQQLEEGGDPGQLWAELGHYLTRMWDAIDGGRIEQAVQLRRSIDNILESGMAEAETWRQIQSADEQRRKLIDSEDKKRERARGYIRSEELRYSNNALRVAVIEGIALIEDQELQRKVRKFIAERFMAIVGPAALPGPPAAGSRD